MREVRSRVAFRGILLVCLFVACFLSAQRTTVRADEPAQVPTGSVPTVTGTPVGAMATVLDNEQGIAYVRSGPHTVYYDIVGTLVVGQQVPVLGRSPGGDWLKVAYPGAPGGVGWVWKFLVRLEGDPPVVDVPPTPTPRVTPTLDPTLAAEFFVEVTPTRLPTFTPPPPLVIPTFPPEPSNTGTGGIPMGLIIIGMVSLGLFGTFISFLRGR